MNKLTDYIFDIETGPRATEELMPFLKQPAAFDPEACKAEFATAREDSDKGRAFLEKKRQEHEAKAKAALAEQIAGAALRPETGRILCIGYRTPYGENIIEKGTERDLCLGFWHTFYHARNIGKRMVGWNIAEFDLPFIIRRSWLLGVKVPAIVLTQGRFLNDTFLDLMKVYTCGVYGARASLDSAGQFLLGRGKGSDDIGGAAFAEHYLSGDEEKIAKALRHLEIDLELTGEINERIGELWEHHQGEEQGELLATGTEGGK